MSPSANPPGSSAAKYKSRTARDYADGSPGKEPSWDGHEAARLSLIFAVVGIFFAGILFGPLAIWQARRAEQAGTPTTAGKVIGWVVTVLSIVVVVLGVIALLFLFPASGPTTSLRD